MPDAARSAGETFDFARWSADFALWQARDDAARRSRRADAQSVLVAMHANIVEHGTEGMTQAQKDARVILTDADGRVLTAGAWRDMWEGPRRSKRGSRWGRLGGETDLSGAYQEGSDLAYVGTDGGVQYGPGEGSNDSSGSGGGSSRDDAAQEVANRVQMLQDHFDQYHGSTRNNTSTSTSTSSGDWSYFEQGIVWAWDWTWHDYFYATNDFTDDQLWILQKAFAQIQDNTELVDKYFEESGLSDSGCVKTLLTGGSWSSGALMILKDTTLSDQVNAQVTSFWGDTTIAVNPRFLDAYYNAYQATACGGGTGMCGCIIANLAAILLHEALHVCLVTSDLFSWEDAAYLAEGFYEYGYAKKHNYQSGNCCMVGHLPSSWSPFDYANLSDVQAAVFQMKWADVDGIPTVTGCEDTAP